MSECKVLVIEIKLLHSILAHYNGETGYVIK